MANQNVQAIEGIGPAFEKRLARAGIVDSDTLLARCCDAQGRREVAEQTGIHERKLLKWVNMADLFRLDGVGSEFAELLERAGVDTVTELATRNADQLAAKLAAVNAARQLARRVPNEGTVRGWVRQAQELPARVSH